MCYDEEYPDIEVVDYDTAIEYLEWLQEHGAEESELSATAYSWYQDDILSEEEYRSLCDTFEIYPQGMEIEDYASALHCMECEQAAGADISCLYDMAYSWYQEGTLSEDEYRSLCYTFGIEA